MSVRLGFAVAAVMIEPDVLFLDEVLAVGDIGFVIKCLNRVRQLTEKSAVIFVSHNMQFVSSFCTRVMVMDHGCALLDSMNPADGIDKYYSLVKHDAQISGSGGAELMKMELLVDGVPLAENEPGVMQGTCVDAILNLRIAEGKNANCFLYIHDEAQAPIVCIPLFDTESNPVELKSGEYRVMISIGSLDLNAGKYSFVLGIRDAKNMVTLTRIQGLKPFRVISDKTYWGKVVRPAIPKFLDV
jgi:lipopolysaccharide transport system ATP-binding protein